MTLLSRGATWLSARLAAATDEAVQYERPSTGALIPELMATPGTQDFEIIQGEASVTTFRSFDWIVAADALDFGAGSVSPAEGDRITRAAGLHTEKYEVLRIPGGKEWTYIDAHNTRMRIHTKLIERT